MKFSLTRLFLVVFIPGAASSGPDAYMEFKGRPHIGAYFAVYPEELKSRGVDSVICPRNQDKDRRSIEERVEDCAEVIKETGSNDRDVILVGHSMGGLIARALAQRADVRDRIDSVVTISTPHKGCIVVDMAIDHVNDGKPDFIGFVTRFLGFTTDKLRYLPQIRADRTGYDSSVFWAQDVPPNSEVKYFSFTTSARKIDQFPLKVTQKLIERELKKRRLDQDTEFGVKNDGMVPEYSQVYGTRVGHIETNHWAGACGDSTMKTAACRRSASVIVPFLADLAGKIGD